MEKRLLGNDLVINENDCNLSCEYCLTGQSNLKQSHSDQLIFQSPTRGIYSCDSELGNRLDNIITTMNKEFDTPLIKLTGGEVFLIKNFTDFISKVCQKYQSVIIQTNGALIKPEHIDFIKKQSNIVLQISLDSHLYSGNSYRARKESIHNKVVSKIQTLLESGLNTEIYTVLNDRSITTLLPFARWLASLETKTIFFPFPIRGPDADKYQVREDQYHYLDELIEEYDNYTSVLPLKKYFTRLQEFYRTGKREFSCHLPRIVISSFSDGELTACPNIWFDSLGNVLDTAVLKETSDKVMNSAIYRVLLQERPRIQACHKCYTPWELLSLYFDDEITLDELCESPTYAPTYIRNLLHAKKTEFKNSQQVFA